MVNAESWSLAASFIAPVRHLTPSHLLTTLVVQFVGWGHVAKMIVALTRYYVVSEKSEALSSEIMVSWIPALAFVLYCASMVAGIYSSRSLKGPFIGVAALARSALLCGWLLWEGIGGNSIAPLVEVSAGRMREIGGSSSITSAALTRGALMTEWLATAVLVVALLQDAHVLFDSVAGVTSSIMNVPIGYEQCELCGEVLLIEESCALDEEEDVSPVTPLTEHACLLSTMSCGVRHQCAVLRRAAGVGVASAERKGTRRWPSASYGAIQHHDYDEDDDTDGLASMPIAHKLTHHNAPPPPSLFPSSDDASALSRWTFSWLNPFVNFSYRNGPAKVFSDEKIAAIMIPTLPVTMSSLSHAVLPAIQVWRNFRLPSANIIAADDSSSASTLCCRPLNCLRGVGAWLFFQFFVDEVSANEFRQERHQSLFSLFLETRGGWRFSKLCVLLKLGQDLLSATSPVMVSYLIHFIKNLNVAEHTLSPVVSTATPPGHTAVNATASTTATATATADNVTATVELTATMLHGVCLCSLMFVLLSLQTLLFQNYLRHLYLSSTEAVTGVRGLILERLLATPPWSVQGDKGQASKDTNGIGSLTEGAVVSLVTVDATRCGECLIFFHNTWGHPLMIAISVALLTYYVGVTAAAAAVASLVIMMPINRKCSARVQEAQRKAVGSGPRVSLTNEVLSNMRLIKASLWDGHLLGRLLDLRRKESLDEEVTLREEAFATFATDGGSILVCVATFTAYYAAGGALTAETLVPALAALNLLRFPLWSLPGLMSTIARGIAAMRRVDAFLGCDHGATVLSYEYYSTRRVNLPNGAIECSVPSSFAFSRGSPAVLQNILMSIKPGEKVAVQGAVGCGKSALLLAMVGELVATTTTAADGRSQLSPSLGGVEHGFRVGGTIAYCGETPWLRHESIRKNICMHRPFDQEWYGTVLSACELREDLARLPEGDGTMVGDRGVQLSGGQQARVALARAVYGRHDIYLLDGVLDALDKSCRVNIFKNVVHGLLRRKTCVFVTHQSVLHRPQHHNNNSNSNAARHQQEGRGSEEEDEDELRWPHRTFVVRAGGVVVELSVSSRGETKVVAPPHQSYPSVTATEDDGPRERGEAVPPSKSMVHTLGRNRGRAAAPQPQKQQATAATHESKDHLSDSVLGYLKTFELRLVLVIVTAILHQTLQTSMDVWFGFWISRRSSSGISFLVFYALIGAATAALSYVRTTVFFRSCLQVADLLVSRALRRLLDAPVSFFDAVAAGTLTTTLSKDVDVLDRSIPESMRLLLQTTLQLTAIAIFNSALSPMFLLVLPLTVSLFLNVSLRFLAVSKEVRKLENRSIGGLASILKETYQGGAAVRCDKDISDALRSEFCEALDVGNRARDVAEQLDRWSGLRLELVSAILATTAAFVSVVYSSHIPPAFAGVAVVNCLTTSRILLMLCRRIGMFQMQFMSVEQILRLQEVPLEPQTSLAEAPHAALTEFSHLTFAERSDDIVADEHEEHRRCQQQQPSHGIEVSHLSLAYRCPPPPPSTTIVYSLSNVNILKDVIRPTDRIVGLSGKSGAGKSSLFNAFLGLADRVEATRMMVHGIDVGALSRREARSNCLIIPQTPPLLKGTWRYNLSLGTCELMRASLPGQIAVVPTTIGSAETSSSCSAAPQDERDTMMWAALRRTGLDTKLDPVLGLDTPLDESGSNFSAGERQLFCIARALMRKPVPPLILLDEITARVDDATDEKVHALIREAFFVSSMKEVDRCNNSSVATTVFMIAHRESSLARCDVVLEFGEGTLQAVWRPSLASKAQ